MAIKKKEIKIEYEQAYQTAMKRIDVLMKKGETNMNAKDEAELRSLALAAEAYEQSIYTVPMPRTLAGIVELRMYEHRLKQGELAKKLGLSDTKLSMILGGKQKPDVAFLKAIHKVLDIDGNQLLEII